MRFTVAASLALAAFVVPSTTNAALAREQPLAQGVISGTVTDGVSGQPVEGAIVAIVPRGQRPFDARKQFSDSSGRFVFTGLPPDAGYSVLVSKSGYFDGALGRRGPLSEAIQYVSLATDEWFAKANVVIWPESGLSGKVTDEHDDPVAGVFVRALLRTEVAGRPATAVAATTTTDDLGNYRIGGLGPGDYTVVVPSVQPSDAVQPGAPAGRALVEPTGHYPWPPNQSDGLRLIYPPTFYGNTTALLAASVVSLDAGAEQPSVDIQLSPSTAVRLIGTLRGPSDAVAGVTLRLLPVGADDLGIGSEVATAQSRSDGSFVFTAVPAGDYVLDAPLTINEYRVAIAQDSFYGHRLPEPSGIGRGGSLGSSVGAAARPGVNLQQRNITGRVHWAHAPVTVGQRDVTVTLDLQRTATLRGRVVAELATDRPAPPTRSDVIVLAPATAAVRIGNPQITVGLAPGEFGADAIQAGSYVFHPNNGWLIKHVTIDGRNPPNGALDIAAGETVTNVVVTVTNASATISGRVQASDTAKEGTAVLVFPVEPSARINYGFSAQRIKSVLTSSGEYEVSALPAGDYCLIAVAQSDERRWQDPSYLERAAAKAKRVTVTWGDRKSLDLTFVDIR